MRTILTIMAGLFLLSGCTRGKPESKVSLRLDVPKSQKVSSLSVSLERLMVNVSRPGIAPVYKVLDSHDSGVTVPNFIEIDVPAGPGTLIQVLAVYEDSTSGAMEFFYKDRLVDLAAGFNEVQIQVESIGGASGVEGRIVGRYALPGPVYPTDFVEVVYDPGSGRRPFVVDESEIVGGWFNFFNLDDVAFSYRLKSTGHLMSMTTNFAAGVRTQSQNVKLQDFSSVNYTASTFPGIGVVDLSAQTSMYRTHTPSGSGSWERVSPMKVIYGFHGSADLPWNGLYVKFYDTATSTFSKLQSLAKDGGDPDCTGITLGETINVTDVATNPMVMTSVPCSINKTVLPYSPSGGSTNASLLTTWTNDYLEVDRSFLDGEGNDNLAPFRGGFRKILSSGSWDVIQRESGSPCLSGCNQAFNFKIVSGSDTIYKAIRIYKSSSVSSEEVRPHKDNFECAKIAGRADMPLVDTVPMVSGTTSYSTGDISFVSGETSADHAVALCPVDAQGRFMPGAVLISTGRMFF